MTSPKKTTKTHATNTHDATNQGDEAMKTTTKTHATKPHHTNAGDEAMKTTTKTHATNTHDATSEGETTMKTTKTQTPTAAPDATGATTSAMATAATTPTAATLAYIQTCTSLLDQIDTVFPAGSSLTSKDKKHAPKARKGSERFAPQLVALAQQHGVNLKLVPLDTISNASAEATALVPLQKRIEALSNRAASRMFSLQSASWSGSSKLYTVLKRLSKDSGDIETGLEPVEHFFNQRHPLVAKEHPKTKKGKEALAAEKAAAQAAAAAQATVPLATPVSTPVATPVTTPAAPPVNAVAHS